MNLDDLPIYEDHDGLRAISPRKVLTLVDQLRGTLSLAEEGLANYAQEVEQLNKKCSMLAMLHYGSPGAMPDDPLPREILRMRGWLEYLQQRKPHYPNLWLLMHDALKGCWAPQSAQHPGGDRE